ncbi:Transcription initiation factor IIA subunit 2 [Maublancomyces gigas]|uniref:Transcription initiation factor IIA subunit 2 n=1 Tax=Discina gigas TaxID=1032678 RepID=A0ABR3GED4_9PEZI
MSKGAYIHYRDSTIGKTLVDALDHFVAIDALTPQLANKIILNFDVAIMDALAERKTEAKLTFKGHLDTYRFCDDVWTFLVTGVTFKFPQSYLKPIETDKISIIAMSAKRLTEP